MNREPDDDAVLALALAAQFDLFISADNALLDLQACESIPIVTTAEALRTIEASSSAGRT